MTAPRAGKTAGKSATSPLNGATIPLGAHAKNTGGKKGRSGRKPREFKTFAVALARDPRFQQRLRKKALAGEDAAMKLVIQYAEGMPPQSVSHTGADGGPLEVIVTRRIVRPAGSDGDD